MLRSGSHPPTCLGARYSDHLGIASTQCERFVKEHRGTLRNMGQGRPRSDVRSVALSC